MAQIHDWFKSFSENWIKPLLSNKKFVAFIMCGFISTGVYTAYDMTGNQLQTGTPVVVEEAAAVEPVKEAEPKPEPQVIEKVQVIEKTIKPVVNCNGDVRAIRDHVKEHH